MLVTPRPAWEPLIEQEIPMATVSRPSPKGQSVRPSRVRPEPIGFARLELLINGNRYKVRPTSLGSIAEVRSCRLQESRTEPSTSSRRPSTDDLHLPGLRSSPFVNGTHGASTCWPRSPSVFSTAKGGARMNTTAITTNGRAGIAQPGSSQWPTEDPGRDRRA